MTNHINPEVVTMVVVDCPLCDRPALVDLDAGTVDCPECRVRAELAADPEPALAIAA